MDLPIKAEGIIFARKDNNYEFLLIKRTPQDGGFWQPVTGTLEEGETIANCLKREVGEETGIHDVNSVFGPIWEFEWKNKKDKTITEYVYAVEVNRDSQVFLNPEEHDDFEWCDFSRAYSLLGKENNRTAFNHFKEKIIDRVTSA